MRLRRCLSLSVFILFAAQTAVSDSKGGAAVAAGDRGREPWVTNIEEITKDNSNFRSIEWTGKHLQLALMSIEVGGEIGLEKHDLNDQFIRIEKGRARVLMGKSTDDLTFAKEVSDDWAVLVPAGIWHNLVNIGDSELKLYSIYTPAEHQPGEVHRTFAESQAAHEH